MKFLLLTYLIVEVVFSAPADKSQDTTSLFMMGIQWNMPIGQSMNLNFQDIIQIAMDRISTMREIANKEMEEIKTALPTQEEIMKAIEENLRRIKEKNETQAIQATVNNIQQSFKEIQKEYVNAIEEQLRKVKEAVNKELEEIKSVINYIQQSINEKMPRTGKLITNQLKPNEIFNLVESILQIIQEQAKESGLLDNGTSNLIIEQIKQTIAVLQNGSNNILQQIG